MEIDYKNPADWSEHLSGIKYVTTRDIDWGLGTPHSKTRLKIPAGRIFDVSVPKGLRWLIDPHNPTYRLAGLIHDHLLHVDGWTRMRAGGDLCVHNTGFARIDAVYREVFGENRAVDALGLGFYSEVDLPPEKLEAHLREAKAAGAK